MATDPFASLRRLPSNAFTRQEQEVFVGGGMGGNPNRQQSATPRIATTWNVNPELFGEGGQGQYGSFQSKWNKVEDLGNGMFQAVFQAPGGDKYSQASAYFKVDPATGEYVMMGTPTQFRQQSSNTEVGQAVGTVAAALGSAAFAPGLAGALGGGVLGGAGAGAILGGGGALLGGGESEAALRGAVTGGVAGGIGGYFQDAYPQASYSNEGRNYMNPASTQGIGGSPINASMAIAEQAGALPGGIAPAAPVGTFPIPGSWAPLDDYFTGGGASDMSTGGPNAGQGGHSFAVGEGMGPEILGTFENMPGAVSPGQTIEITGTRPTPTPATPSPGMSYPLPPAQLLEPKATGPMPDAPLPEVPDPLPENKPPNKFAEFLKNNPRLALTMLGMLGGAGAGQGNAGGGLGGSQSNLTATQAPKFQRQYVAPPPGYRPGFDPEHKYFTGIGNAGTGG